MSALYSSESSRGWVSFSDSVWEECDVLNSSASELSLRLKSGEVRNINRTQAQFCYRNPSAVEQADDFLSLPNLDEPNILHSLRVRYWARHVYSNTGPILIAVNPWRDVDIYNINMLEAYKAGKAKGPHIFGLATKAFRALMSTRNNQCVLISGESGSGKTESTKFVLQVLTAVGENRTGASASIEQQVMLTNPVLEAFGNAKTLRNDNSSRFGKWINVHFDRQGTIAGAEIKTYLLEKARVIHQTDGERNYHIFYQVCGAASQHKMLSDLGLGNPSQFNYTRTCTTANNMDDGKSFERTKQALHFIGFDPQTQQHIFAALSAVLHLGSLAFTADKNGDAIMADDRNLSVMSSLLKVDPQEVRKAVCNRVISAGGETMVKPETLEKAYQCRDALAKALYSKLFDHIVTCVNAALKLKSNMQTMQVSVLDIFGFEVFQFNRFEQFCINYANEKLQLHFNHYNFMLERQLYAKEGIELIESDFVDNSACVELIEGKGWGIQGVLDDVCIMPKGDDTAFLDRLMQSQQVKVHRHFGLAKNRREMFVVHHYAGSVSYHVEGFCEKNKDLLAIDLVNLMRGSQSEFFQKLFENTASAAEMATPSKPGRRGAGGGMGGSVAYKSVSATFKTDLASLMEAINAADPHFVRCINPNSQKKAELFEDTKAVEQLRCGGVIEAVRMCRESYPSRYTHDDFIGTFSCICPQAAQGPDLRQNCFAIVSSIKVDPKLYRLGKTMILLKREVVDGMERMRAQLLGGCARSIQSAVRGMLARWELNRKREIRRKHLSLVRIQGCVRRCLKRQQYAGMVAAVRAQERKRREEEERRERGIAGPDPAAAAAPAAQALQQVQHAQNAAVIESARKAVLTSMASRNEDSFDGRDEVDAFLEDEKETGGGAVAARRPNEEVPVSPLCIRIQVHAEGITEALLFHVDLLASAIRQAVTIKDHKVFLKVYPNTFSGQAAIEWLRGHAARAVFGADADKEKNQQLAKSVALLLAQKLLAVGVFRQVTGSLTKPLEDPNALFRFHEDEKEGPLLNCRSIWFQNAREPLLVVTELLHSMLSMRARNPGRDLRGSEELNNFTAAAAELQLVNINDLSRIQLLAFFLNAYNLMVLHAHVVRGSTDATDFKPLRIPFTRDNQYMIAAYNYSLAEIEERLFCRVLRAKFPKKSDKSRAPEPRVHFALSLGCQSSPRIRIYQPDSLDEDLQRAAVEYLSNNAPKGGSRVQRVSASSEGGTVSEVVLPKVFKWYKDDFGFSRHEIVAYYASLIPRREREEIKAVAMENNFLIRYDHYDWSLNLTLACSETGRGGHHSAARIAAPPPAVAPAGNGMRGYDGGGGYEPQSYGRGGDKGYNAPSQHHGSGHTPPPPRTAAGTGYGAAPNGSMSYGGDYDYRQPTAQPSYAPSGYEARKDAGGYRRQTGQVYSDYSRDLHGLAGGSDYGLEPAREGGMHHERLMGGGFGGRPVGSSSQQPPGYGSQPPTGGYRPSNNANLTGNDGFMC